MNIQLSLCVDNPEIKEVINLKTGEILPVEVIIGSDYSKLEKLRMDLAEANASDELLVAKESPAHIRLKEIVKESLENAPNFSEVAVEKVWRGMDRSKWRKPDVQALWKGTTRIAFEIQLSTTFLHVIAERRLFYRDEGALLCWIFKRFDGLIAFLFPEVWAALLKMTPPVS